jgi:hypothetical protein
MSLRQMHSMRARVAARSPERERQHGIAVSHHVGLLRPRCRHLPVRQRRQAPCAQRAIQLWTRHEWWAGLGDDERRILELLDQTRVGPDLLGEQLEMVPGRTALAPAQHEVRGLAVREQQRLRDLRTRRRTRSSLPETCLMSVSFWLDRMD